jgi:hypothetical protein
VAARIEGKDGGRAFAVDFLTGGRRRAPPAERRRQVVNAAFRDSHADLLP